jgi:hypothetical protein
MDVREDAEGRHGPWGRCWKGSRRHGCGHEAMPMPGVPYALHSAVAEALAQGALTSDSASSRRQGIGWQPAVGCGLAAMFS